MRLDIFRIELLAWEHGIRILIFSLGSLAYLAGVAALTGLARLAGSPALAGLDDCLDSLEFFFLSREVDLVRS